MESGNKEVTAAVLSLWAKEKAIWQQYYSLIKDDQQVQKRLLELITLTIQIRPSVFWSFGQKV